MGCTINPNGRIISEVTIEGTPLPIPNNPVDPSSDKELLCDTGSPITTIPFNNVAGWFGLTTIALGPLVQTNFGPMIKLINVTMSFEVDDPNAGPSPSRSCPEIWVHFRGEDFSGEGFNGILGMDQFDTAKVNPVKSAGLDRAWLDPRVP